MKKLFDFKCPHCGAEDERLVKYEDLQFQYCHTCETLMEKQLSTPACSLQGMDWYKPSAVQNQVEKLKK